MGEVAPNPQSPMPTWCWATSTRWGRGSTSGECPSMRRVQPSRREMQTQGHKKDSIEVQYSADMRYLGQSYEVNVSLPVGAPVDSQHAQAAFHIEHARLYGHASDGEPVEVITARVSASVAGERPKLVSDEPATTTSQHRTRDLSFDGDVLSTPVHSRHSMDTTINGPAAIEQSDTTIIVPPGARVHMLANGCLQLQLKGSST